MQKWILGLRVEQIRHRRSLTREELTDLAGMGKNTLWQIEAGKVAGPRIDTLQALADVLEIPLSSLFTSEVEDKKVEQDHALLLPIREYLFPAGEWTGTVDDTELTLAELRSRVLGISADSNQARYAKMATDIPALLHSIHLAVGLHENEAKAEAYRLMSQVYKMAARLLIQLRDESLACVAVERAMEAAENAGDPVLRASAGLYYCWAFRRQRRFQHAETVATTLAAGIEPSITKAPPEHLAVWGLALAWASEAAAYGGRPETADELLSLARASAVRIGERKIYNEKYWAVLSPTGIAIDRVGNAMIGGDAPLALHLGKGIRRTENVNLEHWARHLLTMADARTATRDYVGAIDTVKFIRQIAPEWIRNHRAAHSIVLKLLDATTVRRHKQSGLDELARFMEVQP